MNVLMFATRIIYGGGEKVRNWLANGLIQSGHKVIYALKNYNDSAMEDLKRVGLYNDIIIVDSYSHLKKKNFFQYKLAIEQIIKKYNVDVLIIFGGSLQEQIIARNLGVKVILSERCDPHSRKIPSQILKQIQYRFADGYVFQTPEASLCYGKKVKNMSVVIPNPIIDRLSEPIFKNLRKEIVSVGRLSKEKNHKMLLEAFSMIHNKIPDYKLVIYGSGPLESQINNYISAHKLSGKVFIIKGKTNITEQIKGASLFVLPSNTEGMPNALIEAMSMGLLCISTDCPIFGPRFLVQSGNNAFLTPINNPSELANNILLALNAPNADNIRHEAVKIRETLNSGVIFSKWITYIEKVFKS